MFAPTIFKEHKFVDGGIIDNLPAQEVRKLGADKGFINSVLALKAMLTLKM